MDETPAMEHLSYEKDELHTTDDVIQEDNFETISNDTATVTDPFNQHDYSVNLQMESMRLSADYPIKPERRSFADGYNDNVTEILTEDTIPESENWEQKCYDQNDRSGEESSQKTHSPIQELLLSKDQVEKTHDVREMPQNDIAAEISESPLQVGKQSRDDFMSYDYDKFNNAFANNSVISTDNDNEGIVNCTDNNNDNIANNTLTKTRNNGPSAILTPSDKMINDAQYSSLAKRISGFELTGQNNDSITTGTNNDSGSNSKNQNVPANEQSSDDLTRKPDDVRKISDKLETFNKNNEGSSIPMKASRPKIEETEMPTKGVVSNLKSLFESNAVNNNNDTCKSASYKLEYGVGRSSGALNKGVFH